MHRYKWIKSNSKEYTYYFQCKQYWKIFSCSSSENWKVWTTNHCPNELSTSWIENSKKGDRKTLPGEATLHLKQKSQKNINKLMFFVRYRGNTSQKSVSRWKKLCDIQIIFKTKRFRTFLPTLRLSFPRSFKPHMVYKFTYSGCNSIYIGQTIKFFTTNVPEHET